MSADAAASNKESQSKGSLDSARHRELRVAVAPASPRDNKSATEDDGDNDSQNSADEALCELLGIHNWDHVDMNDHSDDVGKGSSDDDRQQGSPTTVAELVKTRLGGTLRDGVGQSSIPWSPNLEKIAVQEIRQQYQEDSFCIFPECLSVPAELMRRLTNELVWGGDKVQVDKTFERITASDSGELVGRRELTRLENFVAHHDEWRQLCSVYLQQCVSAVLGEPMLLYKEKLNLKPPGGSGFAPHLDTPSLRIALSDIGGPREFATVMVAIDNMTVDNGCLRLVKGRWSEDNACPVVAATDDNPDGGGRAGAIPLEVADQLNFQDVCCKGGSIVVFNGWVPHRSSSNRSLFPRRAVFLTYNRAVDGDFHTEYYDKMRQLRNSWKDRVGCGTGGAGGIDSDRQNELESLSTIPRI